MLLTEFFQALCLPKHWDVCGLPCRALSCWHLYALEQLGNRYAFGGHGAGPDDAAGLLMICGLDYRQGRKLLTSPRRVGRLLARYHRKIKDKRWSDLHAACMDYSESCRQLPEVWTKQGGAHKSLGGPHTWHVVQCLTSVMGYKVDDAWDESYTLARCWYDVWRESQGMAEIMSDRQRALIEEANRHTEKATT